MISGGASPQKTLQRRRVRHVETNWDGEKPEYSGLSFQRQSMLGYVPRLYGRERGVDEPPGRLTRCTMPDKDSATTCTWRNIAYSSFHRQYPCPMPPVPIFLPRVPFPVPRAQKIFLSLPGSPCTQRPRPEHIPSERRCHEVCIARRTIPGRLRNHMDRFRTWSKWTNRTLRCLSLPLA